MSEYKVTYFNGRGKGELIRLVFGAAGQQFEDDRVEFDAWPARKPTAPLGQMPYLTFKDEQKVEQQLPQSLAVARFVARKFKLAGTNELDEARADVMVDTVEEVYQYWYKEVFRKDVPADFAAKASVQLAKLDKLIAQYGKGGFSVGSALTWADLAVFNVAYLYASVQDSILKEFAQVQAVMKSVEENENVKAYLAKRPVTEF
jgi:glutathione S-transferase